MFLFEAEGVVALLFFVFWIWALFDCIATDGALCRNLPKGVWLILVILLPDIGGVAWLLLGRPEKARWRPGSTDYAKPRRPVGLEDSPQYSGVEEVSERRSAELDRRLEQWEAEQRALREPAEPAKALPAATSPALATGAPGEALDLDAWQTELDRREADVRRRELELRARELEERDRRLEES
jgi:hypothetical protein